MKFIFFFLSLTVQGQIKFTTDSSKFFKYDTYLKKIDSAYKLSIVIDQAGPVYIVQGTIYKQGKQIQFIDSLEIVEEEPHKFWTGTFITRLGRGGEALVNIVSNQPRMEGIVLVEFDHWHFYKYGKPF